MVITRETAEYVAGLSRLKIAEDEIGPVCQELSSILSYMDEINASIDTDMDDVPAKGLSNVIRQDVAEASMDRGHLLENVPEHTEETPIVPKTVD